MRKIIVVCLLIISITGCSLITAPVKLTADAVHAAADVV